MGLMQNHAFSDGSGPNLAYVFFISHKQILALFHFEKPTPGAKRGERGALLREIHAFSDGSGPTLHITFYLPETNTGIVSFEELIPMTRKGGRGARLK